MTDPMFNRQNLAVSLIEQRARELWYNRELEFPVFTRLRWEDGSPLARDTIGSLAFDQLLAEGAITLDGPGVQAVGVLT